MNSELWYELPPDMSMWNNAVLENIARKIPDIPSFISSITWSRIDPATGDAEGMIDLLNGVASAPIIVKGNKLAPVDIVAVKGNTNDVKFYPLSPLFLDKIYADNVLGEPAQRTTESEDDYEGPSRKVKRFKTVDATKYASIEAAKELLEEISKSASVVNWMVENLPEGLTAIYDKANEVVEKVAAAPEIPELTVVWKDRDSFYANGDEVTAAQVSEFCKLANVTDEERSNLFAGIPIVRDNREKVASLIIPKSPSDLVVDRNPFADTEDADSVSPTVAPSDISLTSAILKDGRTVHGLLFDNNAIRSLSPYDNNGSSTFYPPYTNPSSFNKPDLASESFRGKYELFVSTEGYAIQTGIKTTVRVPISGKALVMASEPSDPAIDMVALCIDDSGYVNGFYKVQEVFSLGNKIALTVYDLVAHTSKSITLNNSEQLYEVTDNILGVMYPEEIDRSIMTTGVNGVVTRNEMGDLIVDGTSHTIVNCPYALMTKYASSYEDAKEVCKVAFETGRCEFTTVFTDAKTAARNDNPDKSQVKDTKTDKATNTKDTKSGTDDTYGEDPMALPNPFLDPRDQMSIPGPSVNNPVSSKDLENIIQVNDPQVMDAYLTGNLALSNLSGQETLMKASDSILNAISHLSQLLFLVRQGSLDYLSESDLQVAMNKMTDVADRLGINSVQVA